MALEFHGSVGIINSDIERTVQTVGKEFLRLEGKTLLVTGTKGFIPAYFVDTVVQLNRKVLKKPAHIIALSRSKPGNNDRLSHLLDDPNITFLSHDVVVPFEVTQPVHFIIHGASKASPFHYKNDPIGTMDANSIGTRNMLELSRHHHAESALFLSSGEIYGDPPPERIPTPETYTGNLDPLGPRSCYAESKRFGESLCVNYKEAYKVPVKIGRIWHTYGPGLRLDDGRVIADFISNGIRKEPITLLSEGLSTRSFSYISDTITGLWKILFSSADGEAFNVGNDTPEISMRELANLICELFGGSCHIETRINDANTYLNGAPGRCCPDLNKIRRMLNYKPEVTLREGLERTITWHQKRRSEIGDKGVS